MSDVDVSQSGVRRKRWRMSEPMISTMSKLIVFSIAYRQRGNIAGSALRVVDKLGSVLGRGEGCASVWLPSMLLA
jgi:hypothetical protein